MSRFTRVLLALSLAVAGSLSLAPVGAAAPTSVGAQSIPHYDHVFLVVEENHGFSDVIGNPAAPNLNALAQQYGLATNYNAVTHPSEPNYVAMLGGNTFGVTNDNPYYLNQVNKPSLISQLDHSGTSWKAYLQGLPHAGYQGICYPANCNGAPDKDPLYVAKHNPIPNFTTSLNAADWSRQVPVEQLGTDLAHGTVPSFSMVVPDECHDQHGDPPYCVDSGNPGDPQDQRLVATGDQYLGHLVSTITGASFWAKGNNAIAVVYDEGNDNAGGGGKVATVMVTSHGPRKVRDATAYSHYSLLQTLQRNFGLGCLENTCDTSHVTSLSPLLTVTGASAVTTKTLPVPSFATPTPTPVEPITTVTGTASSGGWRVQDTPKRGKADNTFGAVSAVSPKDVWAVGNFLPDTTSSNPDATLSLAAHFDGERWTSTPTPNVGPNYNTLFGVAAVPGHAWGVGVALDSEYRPHSLIEAWDGKAWNVVPAPKLDTTRDILSSATAVSADNVWAVGEQQARTGRFATLVEHWDGHRWSVVPSPNPGATGNHLTSVAEGEDGAVWAVGQRNDATTDEPLVEHWNGRQWTVTPTPGTSGAVLDGVAVHGADVWAVGQTDNSIQRGRPLIGHLHDGLWTAEVLPAAGSAFSNLTGVAVAGDSVWAVGTFFAPATATQQTLVIRRGDDGWQAVPAPSPGSGDNVLGGISATGEQVWAVGYGKNTNGRDPLIEYHREG